MLDVNQQTIQLGSLKFGQPYEFNYKLNNSSATNIVVEKLILGCNSCTKASVSPKNIAPGETASINVVFTPGNIGPQKKNINVQYKENNVLKNIELKFTAQVNE